MKPRLEVGLAVLLIAGGMTSIALQRWVFVDPTESNDWQRAAQWVAANVDPSDAVMVSPHWREDALTHATSIGDRVVRIRDPIIEDLYQHPRVFVLAESGRKDDAIATLPGPPTQVETEDFGTVTAIRATMPPPPFHWELHDALSEARVSRMQGGKVERCEKWDKRAQRWDCGRRDRWTYVGQAEREVGDDPRRCVWAHPLDRGRTLRLETTVPKSTTIRVRDSFDLRAARLGGDPVLVQIFVNDELRVEDRVAGNDHDWQAHDIDVSGIDGPTTLRIEVDLLGSIKNRFLCINAWATP